jgi:hypothetical protein
MTNTKKLTYKNNRLHPYDGGSSGGMHAKAAYTDSCTHHQPTEREGESEDESCKRDVTGHNGTQPGMVRPPTNRPRVRMKVVKGTQRDTTGHGVSQGTALPPHTRCRVATTAAHNRGEREVAQWQSEAVHTRHYCETSAAPAARLQRTHWQQHNNTKVHVMISNGS